MIWGEKEELSSLPGRLRTKKPLVPVKEVRFLSFIISFHNDY